MNKKSECGQPVGFLRYPVICKVFDTIQYNIYACMYLYIYIYINWLAEFLVSTVFFWGLDLMHMLLVSFVNLPCLGWCHIMTPAIGRHIAPSAWF